MARNTILLLAAFCLTVIATACGGESTEMSAEAETAVADLASRLGVGTGDVDVVVDEEVTWRDGSLGCPEPDLLVIGVLTPGFRVILEVDGTEYAYHGASGQEPVFCESPDPNGTV